MNKVVRKINERMRSTSVHAHCFRCFVDHKKDTVKIVFAHLKKVDKSQLN